MNFKAFYFKTKIIVLDDNKLFLKALSNKLSKKYQVNSFSDPNEALNYITANSEDNFETNPSNFLSETTSDDEDSNYYSVEFSKIKDLIANQNKNNTVTVVIADYSMPLMNGIEFCEKIAHIPALKIMLTGHSDVSIAIDAFNRRVIDRFLIKDSPNMYEVILENIELMQKEFFEKQSYPLLHFLSANKKTLINSREYNSHFRDTLSKLNAAEFYILDSIGSYLIISEQKEHYYFIVLLDIQLDELVDVAKNSHAPHDLLRKMADKTHTPILLKEEDYKIPVSNWNNLLHPIEKKNEYYYCLISDKSINNCRV